jgi:hypothetical protein
MRAASALRFERAALRNKPMTGAGRSIAYETQQPGAGALALLARETRVRRGPVPCELDGEAIVRDGDWRMAGDRFVLRGDHGIRVSYERGKGVTLDLPPEADPRDAELWLNGTLYATRRWRR